MDQFWTPEMRDAVLELMAKAMPKEDWLRSQARDLEAFPVCWDLWSYWFLRPGGAAIAVDQVFEPGRADTKRELGIVLSLFVRLAEKHPELRSALPARPADARDCPTCPMIQRLRPGKITCTECGGLGWLPEPTA